MGRDKGLLEFGDEPLITRTARMLEPIVQEVIVIGAPERYSHLRIRVIPDMVVRSSEGEEPLSAPLVGIATALSTSSSPWNLILACDLAYLTPQWLDWFLVRARSSNAQVVIPRTSRGLEPLAAVYKRDSRAPILDALKQGICKVTDATSHLRTEIVEENDWRELDPEHHVLTNMNSPADYQRAQEWWENQKHPG